MTFQLAKETGLAADGRERARNAVLLFGDGRYDRVLASSRREGSGKAMGADSVFISYSHDSPEHSERVLELANDLIAHGLDVELDQFVTRPEHGWPHWCAERLEPENSKFVLVVCTPTYHDRVRNKVAFDQGRGVFWEGALIHQYIYEAKGNTTVHTRAVWRHPSRRHSHAAAALPTLSPKRL